jgi:hypothetical protein
VDRTTLDWTTRRMASAVLAMAIGIAVASGADTFSAEQIALFGKCEKTALDANTRLFCGYRFEVIPGAAACRTACESGERI